MTGFSFKRDRLARSFAAREVQTSGAYIFAAVVVALVCAGGLFAPVQGRPNAAGNGAAESCTNDDSGLKLPDGFCASVFADGVGHVRHMVVAPDGVVYANTWSGEYYGNDTTHEGGFLVALQDKAGAGKADVEERFGETRRPMDMAAPGSGSTRDRSMRRSMTGL